MACANALQLFASDQIDALTTAQVRSLTATQLNAIGTELFQALDFAKLSWNQLRGLTTTAIGDVTEAQVSALNSTQLSLMATSQIDALSPGNLQALASTQINALTTRQVSGLSTDDSGRAEQRSDRLADHDAGAEPDGNPAQFADHGRPELARYRQVSGAQIAGLTTTAIDGFSEIQIGSFSAVQIASLSAAQIGALSSYEIQAFSSTQANALTASQFGGLTTTTLNRFASDHIGSFSTTQVGADHHPAQWAPTNSLNAIDIPGPPPHKSGADDDRDRRADRHPGRFVLEHADREFFGRSDRRAVIDRDLGAFAEHADQRVRSLPAWGPDGDSARPVRQRSDRVATRLNCGRSDRQPAERPPSVDSLNAVDVPRPPRRRYRSATTAVADLTGSGSLRCRRRRFRGSRPARSAR